MYLYVEQWNVTQDWLDLSKDKRREMMERLEDRIQDMSGKGIVNLGWAMNDEHTPHRGDYRYMAVWKMPSMNEVKLLEENLGKTQWYKYFSQANSRGKMDTQDESIDFLINIEEQSSSLTE